MERVPNLSNGSRKQNVACDACRAKKIRCQRTTLIDRVSHESRLRLYSCLNQCAQCAAKDSACTSRYIELLRAKGRNGRKYVGDDGNEDSNLKMDTKPGRITGVGVEAMDPTGRPHDRCEQPSDEKGQRSTQLRPKGATFDSGVTAAQTESSISIEGHVDVEPLVFRLISQ